jgi:hypothetical protein
MYQTKKREVLEIKDQIKEQRRKKAQDEIDLLQAKKQRKDHVKFSI